MKALQRHLSTLALCLAATGCNLVSASEDALYAGDADTGDTGDVPGDLGDAGDVPDADVPDPSDTPDADTDVLDVPDADADVPDADTDVPDADTDVPDADTDVPDADVPDATCDPEACAPYACIEAGTACGTSCEDDRGCADTASCIDGACVPREYRWVAVVSTAFGSGALDNQNPGPDIDAIGVRVAGRLHVGTTVVAGEIGRLGDAPNARADFAGVSGGLDTIGATARECNLDAEPGYTSIGGTGGFVVVELDDPIAAGDLVSVFEVDSLNCADAATERPDSYDVYVIDLMDVAERPGSATRITNFWCRVGSSSTTGGTFAAAFDPEACADTCATPGSCSPAPDEVCDNGRDDDTDGNVDCDDHDCAEAPACNPTAEVCNNRVDDDVDGFVDCYDPDCADALACEPDCSSFEIIRGGGCSARWGASDLVGRPLSYVRAIELPERSERCCFDFTGDGVPDNNTALLFGALGALGGDIDFPGLMQDAIDAGEWVSILEWNRWDAGVPSIQWYAGTNDRNGDGSPDQSATTRQGGLGVFQLFSGTLDAFGALSTFNNARFESGTQMVAGPANLVFPGIGGALGEFPGAANGFSLQRAMFRGTLRQTARGIESVDGASALGMEFGAVVPLDDLFGSIEDSFAACTCAGFDSRRRILNYGDDGAAYTVSCAQTPSGDCSGAGTVCENLSLVCSFLPSLPALGLNDVDLDGNGVGDGLSLAFRMSLVGAAVGSPAVVAGP